MQCLEDNAAPSTFPPECYIAVSTNIEANNRPASTSAGA